MKSQLRALILLLAFAAGVQTPAQAYFGVVNNLNAVIPDGDLNGYQNSQSVSGVGATVSQVTVTLNISGGFNGDLYAYLYHDGVSAILLNRVGLSSLNPTGYSDAGFGPNASLQSFTLDDQASHDIHFYRASSYTLNGSGQVTGQWQPDGRAIDPLSSASAFDTAGRSSPLGIFNGMDPNGVWTLYLADVSPGGQSTLVSWGLMVVPEPSSCGLILLGGGLAAALAGRRAVGQR